MFAENKYRKRWESDERWTEVSACHHDYVPYDWHGKKECVAEKMDSVEFDYEEPDNLPNMPLCEDADPMGQPGACCDQEADNTDTWCLALKCHHKIINGMEKCGDWDSYNLK